MYVNRFYLYILEDISLSGYSGNSIIMLCFVMFLYSSTCALFARLRQPTWVIKYFLILACFWGHVE